MNLGVTENEVEGAIPTTGIENLSIEEKERELTYQEIINQIKETPSFGERFSLEDYWEKVFKPKFESGDASLSQYPEIEEKIKNTLESLVEQGKLTKNEDDTYALANEEDLEKIPEMKSGHEVVEGTNVYITKYALENSSNEDIFNTREEITGALMDLEDDEKEKLESIENFV